MGDTDGRRANSGRARWLAGLTALLLSGWAHASAAADIEEAQALFRSGKYEEAEKVATEEATRAPWREPWHLVKIQSLAARGEMPAATTALEDAVRRFPASIVLRLLAHDLYRRTGRAEEAGRTLDTVDSLVQAAPQRYDTPEGRVALGRYLLLRGLDAKKVLDRCYDPAIKRSPDLVDAYYASAELALEKQDFALAASTLARAPKSAAEDPRYHYLTARAFADDDRVRSGKALVEALKLNPRHVDSLLLQADQRVDEERYDEAAGLLDQVIAIDPGEPRAWAYRAVLAHLRNDADGEAAARKSALARWSKNPEVDHVIGRELARKYRFAEGSAYQRRSLEVDADYAPAKAQLCQDLLRLGDEEGGWKLAAEIFAADGYNVPAFNLVTLRDQIAGYRTLVADGFLVRMDPREADLYGARVLALLKEARATLGAKYGVEIKEPVIVEIFPRKKEFAVRTFGLPGAEGFLGVCFGRVITANSPASQGETPSNWEAVLWHEFCHAITLHKTRNKMPRWLSEGISVHEEAARNRAWATPLNPTFRAMILGDDLTPLSRLSSAFLAPKSAMHLQFAYFESSLAVEFLEKKAGLEALKGLLGDLGAGASLNEALPRRAGMSLDELDASFSTYIRGKALAVAPEATWDEVELPPGADSATLIAWLKDHPANFEARKRLAVALVAEGKWPEAKAAIEALRKLYPDYLGQDNPSMLSAAVARKTSETAAERTALEDLAARDGNAQAAYLRLIEIEDAAGDWKAVERDANRLLAVNPLVAAPFRALALAEEKLGDRDGAIIACKALALLDRSDPAGIHFRLARLLKEGGKPDEARREVLKSLEDAPRFLDAHKLLLELARPEPGHGH